MKYFDRRCLYLILTVIVLVSGCSSKGNGAIRDLTAPVGTSAYRTEGDHRVEADIKTVKIFQFKVEIAEALNRMKSDFEQEYPNIKLDIQTVGGGVDYVAALKAKFAAQDEPDLFNNGGYEEMNMWIDHLEELSDQPWVQDAIPLAKEPMLKDGKLYGMPMNIEGYGFIYNKDLFAKAGVTSLPKTLSQLREVAQKLQEAGITPFVNGYQERWIVGTHNVNVAFAHQLNPDQFINGLHEGTATIAGNAEFMKWAALLDLTLQYGNSNPLTTDYYTQVAWFAEGKAAMMQQGNWTQVQIDNINPNLNIGILPMPIDDDEAHNDKLFVGVPNHWVINKNSAVKEEAKLFLNWMVSSEKGKRYITEEFKFIPAFTSIPATADQLGDLAADVMRYRQVGKVLSWNWFKYPDGVTQDFGSTVQEYIAGRVDKTKMFEELDKDWSKMKGRR